MGSLMNARNKKQETTVFADTETIQLRTYAGKTGLLLERESSAKKNRDGDVRITQVLLANPPTIDGFLEAERYPQVAPIVRHWVDEADVMEEAANDDGGSGRTREEVVDLIAELPDAPDESVLINKTLALVRALGAETAFFFLAEKNSSGEVETYRILVISAAQVSQTYVDRRWYATDPLITHSAKSDKPYFSSDVGKISSLSGSRREMAEFAREMGLASCVALPAHALESRKFGALYAANSSLPEQGGEEPLRANWRLLKLLSAELLAWYIKQEELYGSKSTNLSPVELSILNAKARGEPNALIAETLGTSMRELLRKHFPSIREKLGVETIDHAVAAARERNLLASASERKVCYVVYSRRYGVFLRREGSLGTMQFWSSSPYEIDDAETFPDAQAAQRFIDTLETGFDAAFHRVEVHYSSHKATVADCVASGLPGWAPHPLDSGAPADDSSTWGTLDDDPAEYH